MKIKVIFLLMTLFMSFSSSANFKCTDWTKTRGITCIFAGERANVYERQCENYCWYNSRTRQGNWGPDCDREKVCYPESPANFRGLCGPWIEHDGITCRNPNTGKWEQKWVRACTVGLKESWCSDEYPVD